MIVSKNNSDVSARDGSSKGGLLRLIALFKLVKACLLIAVGVGALNSSITMGMEF